MMDCEGNPGGFAVVCSMKYPSALCICCIASHRTFSQKCLRLQYASLHRKDILMFTVREQHASVKDFTRVRFFEKRMYQRCVEISINKISKRSYRIEKKLKMDT